MAHITDPKLLIALQIHKGAIRLMERGFSSEVAFEASREIMQELYPQENVSRFRFPHWTSANT